MKGVLIVAIALMASACANTQQSSSQKGDEIAFSIAEVSGEVKDENGYGCEPMDKADLVHFAETADFESQRTVHDHFSLVGCSVTGRITLNGETSSFIFDYGGVMRLDDGRILACGEDCCQDGYEYCTWEASTGEN